MQFTFTQITANRELEGNAAHFLALLGGKKLHRMIDPFCGSASLSLHAMKMDLAREYVVNDAYAPVIELLQTVKDNPVQLKELYGKYINNGEGMVDHEDVTRHIDQLTKKDNLLCPKAASWLFLANRLKNNRPLFFGEKLISQISNESATFCPDIYAQIDAAHALIRRHTTSFFNLHAKELFQQLGALNENDFVFLDPPYPGVTNPEQTIFFRPDSDDELYPILMEIIGELSKQKVSFIFNYDLFWGQENPNHPKYLVSTQDVPMLHLILVSRNANDPEFELLFEHIYVSNNISLERNQLPSGFFLYDSIKNFSYEQARRFVTSVMSHSDR